MTEIEKTDEEIINEYNDGDENALSLLIKRHIKSVYGFCRSTVHSDEEAEDITQETFVKLWKNIKKYKTGNIFKSWLLTIARNTAYDYLRKRKNVAFSRFEDEDGRNKFMESLESAEPEVIELIIASENKETVRRAIEKIPLLYREVLSLRYGEELTFDEIGHILGKPLNTVKSQHRRALIELRKLLDKDAPK